MTKRILIALLLACMPGGAVELIDFGVESEYGRFRFLRLKIDGKGKSKGFKVGWNGSATNNTGRQWHKVTFCVEAFDAQDDPILPSEPPAPGETCLVRLWMYEWRNGTPAKWKGSQKIKVGAANDQQVEVHRIDVSVAELLEDPESVRVLTSTCTRVWPVAMQVFLEEEFRPTVSDRDSFVASFEYEGGSSINHLGGTNDVVKSFTKAYAGFWKTWKAFRIDSASLMLRSDEDYSCRADIKMSFAGFDSGWYVLESNHQYEKKLLNMISERLAVEYEDDLNKAISKLPEADSADEARQEPANDVRVEVTSEPGRAEIEIDGEYIGSTPSTLTLTPGLHRVTVRKSGYKLWERKVRFGGGDERTIHAKLERP